MFAKGGSGSDLLSLCCHLCMPLHISFRDTLVLLDYFTVELCSKRGKLSCLIHGVSLCLLSLWFALDFTQNF